MFREACSIDLRLVSSANRSMASRAVASCRNHLLKRTDYGNRVSGCKFRSIDVEELVWEKELASPNLERAVSSV